MPGSARSGSPSPSKRRVRHLGVVAEGEQGGAVRHALAVAPPKPVAINEDVLEHLADQGQPEEPLQASRTSGSGRMRSGTPPLGYRRGQDVAARVTLMVMRSVARAACSMLCRSSVPFAQLSRYRSPTSSPRPAPIPGNDAASSRTPRTPEAVEQNGGVRDQLLSPMASCLEIADGLHHRGLGAPVAEVNGPPGTVPVVPARPTTYSRSPR